MLKIGGYGPLATPMVVLYFERALQKFETLFRSLKTPKQIFLDTTKFGETKKFVGDIGQNAFPPWLRAREEVSTICK